MNKRQQLYIFSIVLFYFIPNNVSAQNLLISDGFSDGDFTQHPAWYGTEQDFEIITSKDNALLHLRGDSTSGGVSYLSTPLTSLTGYWEFYIRMDFHPSAGNNTRVYLVSDRQDLTGPVNGYALQAGENGSDDVFKLLRVEQGHDSKILLSDTTKIADGGGYRVKISRSEEGTWSLAAGKGYTGILHSTGQTIQDTTWQNSNYFGLVTTYTSTRFDRFYFDFKIDLPPFSLEKVVPIKKDLIKLDFNAPIDTNSVQSGDFSFNKPGIQLSKITYPSPDSLALHLTEPLSSGTYTLIVHNIQDQNGRLLHSPDSHFFSIFDQYQPGDIGITEIMYDPPSGSPEYIEIQNISSDHLLNLGQWLLGDKNNLEPMDQTTLKISPGDYKVITQDTTSLSALFGPGPYIQLSSLPALNNGGDAVRIVNPDGHLIDSLFYKTDWGRPNHSIERKDTDVASTYASNWGPSPALYGTPGKPNQIQPDTLPPVLSSLIIETPSDLILKFSEALDVQSANDNGNFKLSGSVSIDSVQFIAPDSVALKLHQPLENTHSYNLSVYSVRDIFGNTTQQIDTSFTYYKISQPDSGQVFVNEFMYDPPSPLTEYIELYNRGPDAVDVGKWTLNDSNGNPAFISEKQSIIPPDSFRVLVPNRDIVNIFPDIPITLVTDFPSLNNGGDRIVIRDAMGRMMDSLSYHPSWGGQEVALERKSLEVPASYSQNWGNSPSPDEGTPGSRNQVPPDHRPPRVTNFYVFDQSAFRLEFSEPLDRVSAKKLIHYQLPSSIHLNAVSIRNETVTLLLNESLSNGQTYHLHLSGLQDIFGNTMADTTAVVRYLVYGHPDSSDVVINEFCPGNCAPGIPAFIELYNRSDQNFNLKGWTVGTQKGSIVLSSDNGNSNLNLTPDHYLVLSPLSKNDLPADQWIIQKNLPLLKKDDDIIYLKNGNGKRIDSLHYNSHWNSSHLVGTYERRDPGRPSNDPDNWVVNESEEHQSAGLENVNFNPDKEAPHVLFAHNLTDGSLEVRFNEFIQKTSLLKFMSNGNTLHIVKYNAWQANKILLKNHKARASGLTTSPVLKIKNLSDFTGNTTNDQIPVALPPNQGDIIINEIMSDPIADAHDGEPDQSEYIEIYNRSNHAISLEGLSLHGAPDENKNVNYLYPVTSRGKWLLPADYALLYPETNNHFKQSRIYRYFDVSDSTTLFRFDRSSLGLASKSDAIYLSDSTGQTLDSVYYRDTWHNPNLIDTKGIALERINPGGASDNPDNWSSSAADKGGTPGAQNSIQQIPESRETQAGIQLEPNPFSPDGDGHEDRLFIHYKMEQPDYQLRIRIFDRYGRIIRHLADNKTAGLEGNIIWDGLNDDRHRNRMGIYIILFEAFNSAKGQKLTYKKTVVLAHQL